MRTGDQAAHHLPLGPEPRLQLGAILFDVDDPAGDARCNGRPRDGRCDPQEHARIERFGYEILRSEFQLVDAVRARD